MQWHKLFLSLGALTIYAISPGQAEDLPIADIHLHASAKFAPVDIRQRMDRNGIRWAGSGARGDGSRQTWEAYSKEIGDRWIAFAGQTEMIAIYKDDGVSGMEDAENAAFKVFLAGVEEDLKAGRVKGIGEIFVSNKRSSSKKWFRHKAKADAPSIRALFSLAAQYGVVLAFHMEGDKDSLAQLGNLLTSDRSGSVILNHCGVQASAAAIRALMEQHPNVYCEFAVRYPPLWKPSWHYKKIFDASGIEPEWQKLIENHPDRFMIGTDIKNDATYDKAIKVVRTGLLGHLSPETARKVAYENAQRLFDLK